MTYLYCQFALLVLAMPLMVSAQATKPDYVAEVYFVVDSKVVSNYMKVGGYTKTKAIETIKEDMNFIINEVNKYYATMEKHGIYLQIRMTRLDFPDVEIFEDCKLIHHKDLQTDLALAVFRAYLDDNKLYEKHPFDIGMVLTGHDLFGSRGSSISGYAQTGAACMKGGGIAVAEFAGTQSNAITIAHELGHSLGSGHDGSQRCPPSDGYILTPTSNPRNTHRWEFSDCTVENIHRYILKLDNANNNCLTKETTTAPPRFSISSMNGKDIMDAQKICQRSRLDPTSFLCLSPNFYGGQAPHGDPVCHSMFCGKRGTNVCSQATPTEGMVCDVGKRCDKGRCVKTPASFPVPRSVKAGCIYGDVNSGEIFQFKGDCAMFLTAKGVGSCYNRNVRSQCCATCEKKRNGISDNDCQWGDKSPQCAKYSLGALCPSAANRRTCCYKCRNYSGTGKRSDIDVVPSYLLETAVPDFQEPVEIAEVDDVIGADVIVNMD